MTKQSSGNEQEVPCAIYARSAMSNQQALINQVRICCAIANDRRWAVSDDLIFADRSASVSQPEQL